ncbi:nitrile hydratase subunit beta [Acuticoccus sp. MNP-M23]|uniref:SH3-like domain-containing protein n=1 Tax=Acuticoccus sp. MNP-M23 TaxID=3072793 RepID=UPI002814A4D8|nr:SH3-like domain-containing protein [Acuticoccus sp. MNP-M23]WMS43844.1 nitrile hydratase subunit beta [Acuticoccus sp. MNP-M23]
MTREPRHRFAVGDQVTVLDLGKAGHVRIPHYVRGRSGTVVQYCGRYLNPEDLAVGVTSGPGVDLYRVAFDQNALWPGDGHPAADQLITEIYDHWLTATSGAAGVNQSGQEMIKA